MKRLRAALSLLLALALIFTVVFIIEEQDHDCCKEHCSVCAVLDACPGSDNGTMLCSSITVTDHILDLGYGQKEETVVVTGMHRISPVAEKVRLNN